ncbi:uncharacterized protein LOC142231134 [Haematobia irritans]|uniref:uncharacterized protein LOC142231134 n=1 Tax=Haematobia irritans TaxID=7368 RepID=UPI003F4F7C15
MALAGATVGLKSGPDITMTLNRINTAENEVDVEECLPGEIVSDGSFIRRFCAGSSNMNIGFCNVQSIKPGTRSTKFDELKNILCSGHLDIIGFAETWLKPYVSSKSINIPGYNLFRSDRCGIRGGGVACYISSGLNAKILTSISEPGCEAIFLQIRTSVAMFIVGIVYLPRGDVDALERSISDIVTRHFLTRCNLTVFHNDKPTHYNCSSDSVSLIDYSLVSCTSSVLRSNQFYFPAVNSYHAFLLIQYELPNNTASCYTTFRNYSAIDMNNLVEDVVNADFVSLYSTNDTNVQLSVLNTIFYELFNTHVPERAREVSRSRRAWFTPEIRAAIANRDLAYRAYMENKTARNKDIYNGYRAEARRMIRRAKREYGARLFGGINSPRDFWSRMRNAGASKSDSYSCDIDPDDLNICFTSVSSSSSSSFSSPNYPDRDDDFNFRCVDEYEIFCAISSIKSNATGHDSIPVKFIKLIYPFISRHLLHFFNTIIMTGIFPANWKLAKVFPLRKKGTSGKECSDFRPICVLPALSKAFEIILKDQISDLSSQDIQPSILNSEIYARFPKWGRLRQIRVSRDPGIGLIWVSTSTFNRRMMTLDFHSTRHSLRV